MATELEQIAERIAALEPPDKLRLAADLMEKGRGRLAHTIAEKVVLELGAAIAIQDLDERASRSQPSGEEGTKT